MHSWSKLIFLGAALAAIGVLTTGCGPKRPKTVRVTGVVTYRGQPLEGARVMFHAPGGRPASGTTDQNGRFQLETFSTDDGAIIGDHVVTISKYVPLQTGASFPGGPDEMRGPGPPALRQVVPSRYTTPAASPLKATVTAEGPNDFTFELTD